MARKALTPDEIKIEQGDKCEFFVASGSPIRKARGWIVPCRCICGEARELSIYDFQSGRIKSCGCKRKELLASYERKGTLATDGHKTCSTCLKNKTVDNYVANKKTKDGLLPRCKDCTKQATIKIKFGLDNYQELLDKQDGVCAICKQSKGKRKLAVDHCHKTGIARGLLCGKCNKGIGLLGDSVSQVLAAYGYLHKYEKQQDNKSAEQSLPNSNTSTQPAMASKECS